MTETEHPPEKPKYPLELAMKVAEQIVFALKPVCRRIIVAGSIRRQKPQVGDIEILYVPEFEYRKGKDLFEQERANLVNERILALEYVHILERRKNKAGHETYGEKNKLMVHPASGIPVDLFETTKDSWWNYLVCRTGPAELNALIATLAQEKGWKWNPYDAGFSQGVGLSQNRRHFSVLSEKDVFDFVGLEYVGPEGRSDLVRRARLQPVATPPPRRKESPCPG